MFQIGISCSSSKHSKLPLRDHQLIFVLFRLPVVAKIILQRSIHSGPLTPKSSLAPAQSQDPTPMATLSSKIAPILPFSCLSAQNAANKC